MKKRLRRSKNSTRKWKEPFPMASIERGDVFLVNFDPTVGAEVKKTRPAVIVSNNVNNDHSPLVSISPITSNVSKVYSFEVEIPTGIGGLRTRSKIMPNQTRAVDKIRLLKKMGHLPQEVMDKIDQTLKLHYDL
ncbi:MAG: MazF family transcriptional regulator [Deltaproteobacteria bacterium CG12_big_fil_rev_8_21_14_0_65_43_10]|nr:MAG: MazF family transcriptional regulator [Deltaproteobacteria bacterium CG12_big_fil_rev_8_21_14_0_65_43_10]PIU85210.1 MAG: MazF family transcriptional regulator [Deltaproteobacteria bacterium CG06_land_8_20_14_3_00_44_19]PIX24432.1 MAG: MazF family transcriptional regulator [Deltaproteobacteria bacterium CG_4_8_14_3_um_filter_43_13]PIZ20214.1 MAG: MazF family transcriptional regulator [Deltaproteobacteria bacterium CG_4_10_14_0_8_um_filter_43_12]PJB46028.1 MAG: MazF family transcriptional